MDWVCKFKDLPDKLYRVQTPGVRVTLNLKRGFYAPDTLRKPRDKKDLADLVAESMIWVGADTNPLINLFSDKDLALDWAYGLSEKYGGLECQVYTISKEHLQNSKLFQFQELHDWIGIAIAQAAAAEAAGTYFCLHDLPACAISEVIKCWQRGSPEARHSSYDTDLLKHIQDAGCVQSHEPGDGVLTNADVEDDEDEDDDGDEDEQYDYDVEHLNEYYWHGRRRT